MVSNIGNLTNIVSSYVGVAIPTSLNRQQNQYRTRQQFATIPRIGAFQKTLKAALNTTKNTYNRVAKLAQNLRDRVRDHFKLGKFDWKLRYIELFTQNDEHIFQDGRRLRMWLNRAKRLNLDPTRPGDPNYDTILEAIKNGMIILDWDALVQI